MADEGAPDKAAVVEVFRQHGLAEAARRTGVPKSTIRRWAAAAGVQLAVVTATVAQQTQAATEASAAARKARTEELKASMLDKAMAVAHTSLDAELGAVRAVRDAQNALREGRLLSRAERDRLSLLETVSLRELTGARTRAVHDVQLLDGGETERGGGGVNVVFVQPPPTAATGPAPTIIQLEPETPRR